MIPRALTALPALLLAAVGTPSSAAPVKPEPSCTDDKGVDRCVAEQQGRVRALFGLRPIEEHQAAGDQVRRVFYVDGYGRDLIAIAFVRAKSRDPMVRVHFPRDRSGVLPEPIEAPVPRAAWRDMIDRSAYFERDLAPVVGAGGMANICLHSWVYTIEATDPALPGWRPATLRRKVADACGGGPAQTYARDVSRAALPLLTHCATLDPAKHRNEASMLAACRMLEGDRMAAAEVLNLSEAFQRVHGPQDAAALAGVFDYRAKIDWNGRGNQGVGSAAAFWAAAVAPTSGRPSFYIEAVRAESANRMTLTGTLSRAAASPGGQANAYETAKVEQIWRRDGNNDVKVESATIGPWVRTPEG